MDLALNFTLGLTEGISWPWPIAVYLFLAGISGGAVATAIMMNLYRKQTATNTPLLKAATLIGFVTIVLGMVCLVLDLTNPLYFWRILVFYNPTSVMSLGVMALLCLGVYVHFFKGYTWMGAFGISGCVGVSLLVAMAISSAVGTVIPMFFHKIKVDPAVASGPLITTVNDLVAVVTYYGMAWLLLIR